MFNLNLKSVALMLLQSIVQKHPEVQGHVEQAIQIAQSGRPPSEAMEFIEGHYPELKDNQTWDAIKGQDGPGLMQYAKNFASSLGIFN